MASPGNVDIREIDRFDSISDTWWDLGGEMRTLHVINPLRLNFIMQNNTIPHPRVLDVGCGGGILAEALAKAGASATGIDLSQDSIRVAKRHADSQGLQIEYQCVEVGEFTRLHEGFYDIVTCMEMLEHVPYPEKIVTACAQALKPGGKAYFSTINRTIKSFIFAVIIGEYVLHLLPEGSHKFKRLIRLEELNHWATSSGLLYLKLASLIYNPFTGRFKLVPDRLDVNYMVHYTLKS